MNAFSKKRRTAEEPGTPQDKVAECDTSAAMGGLGMVELRFNELRDRLDLLGYRQPLSLESLPLAEQLLADLIRTTDSLKTAKHRAEIRDKVEEEGHAAVEPYRQDNARLCQELAALHQQQIKSREQQQADTKELRTDVRKLMAENDDLRFLSGQYKKQADAAELRLFRLLEQQAEPVASVSLSGERQSQRQRRRRQRMDISDQLVSESEPGDRWRNRLGHSHTQTNISSPQTINLVSAAERRLAELEQLRQAAEEARHTAEQTAADLSTKIGARDDEIRRLTGQLEGGRPVRAILADYDTKENDMSRANLPYAELKRANGRLEKQLRETVRTQHEAMQRAVQLAQKNEALKRELADLDRIVHVLDEDRDQMVRATTEQLKDEQARTHGTVQELDAATARQEALRSQTEQQAAELAAALERVSDAEAECEVERRRAADTEAQLAAARQSSARLEGDLAAARQNVTRLEALIGTMRLDRTATHEKLDQLTENEKHLVLELDRLSRQKTNKARIPDKTRKLIESLEEQREYYKRQVDELFEQLQSNESRRLESGLEEDLEFYRAEIRRLEEENHRCTSATKDGNRLQTEVADLRQELAERGRQLSGSAAQLGVRTDESEQLRRRLDEALRSLHRLSDSESAATVASTAHLESLIRTVEQERNLASGDCHRIEQERNELRNRLKVATETQLADRVKMESRIAELEALVGAAETDRTVQHSQSTSHRALISSLEAQVKNLQGVLSDSQVELSRAMSKNTKMKTFVDRGESSLNDCENQLIKQAGEIEAYQKQTTQLERQCASLRGTVDELQRELRRQTQLIGHVIQERDKFQNDVDDKTELLDEHRQQLEKCNAHIVQLEATITNLTGDLGASRDHVSTRSHELRALRGDLERAEAQQSSSDRHRGAVAEENRRLQSDLTTLTNELQQLKKQRQEADDLQEDLKQQVRDYVNEVTRVEELLGFREEERSELLRQYKDLTVEASGLEESNHTLGSEVATLRSEVAARDAELSHAHDTIALLNDDVQKTSVACQQADVSVSRLNESVAEVGSRLERCEADRSRMDREIATCRELNLKLETQRERLSRQLLDRDRDLDKLRSENATLQSELETMRQQLSAERSSIHELEALLNSSRGREYHTDAAAQQRAVELEKMSDRLAAVQKILEAQKVETGLYRSQAAERDLEVERLNRQMIGERFEKERLSQELRRLRKEATLAGTSALPAAGGATYSSYGSPPVGGAVSRSVTEQTSVERQFTSTETSSGYRRLSDSPTTPGPGPPHSS